MKFEPMNFRSKESAKFIQQNLNKNIFKMTNRVSINQFLSIFNIIGSENANKLDKIIHMLKKENEKINPHQFFKEKDEF